MSLIQSSRILSELEIEFARNPEMKSACRLVDCYLELDRYIEALVVSRRCIRQWPDNPESHALLCGVYLVRGNHSKISDTLDKIPNSCHITAKLEAYARMVGNPLAARCDDKHENKPEPTPPAISTVRHAEKHNPAAHTVEADTVIHQARFLPKCKQVDTSSSSQARHHRTLFLFAGLASMLCAYIAWTWSIGQHRERANQLILAARQALKKHTERGYRKALAGFSKALREITDDPPALVGACWTTVVLAGEYDGYDHLLVEGKEYLDRARSLDVSAARLTAAEALLEAYGGDPGHGIEVLQAYHGDINQSAILLDAMIRLEIMSGKADMAADRSWIAMRHGDFRLLLASVRATMSAKRYEVASSLLESAARLDPEHSAVKSIRADLDPLLMGPKNLE